MKREKRVGFFLLFFCAKTSLTKFFFKIIPHEEATLISRR